MTDPRIKRVADSLARWLPRDLADERANNICAAMLVEEYMVENGYEPDPSVTIEASVATCLNRPDIDPRLRATPEQIAHAIAAWRGETSCDSSPPFSSSS